MDKQIEKYKEYISKRDSCFEAFKTVVEFFNIKSGLYPGSYIHITPSLLIPNMHYVENDKKAMHFFSNLVEIKTFINQNKEYKDETIISFDGYSYWNPLSTSKEYDLLISLYSGFISQANKSNLRVGGVLLTNDSHGDATRAYHDDDYELIGVMKYTGRKIIVNKDQLDSLFTLKKANVDLEKVISEMKGPKYLKRFEYYIFKKKK